MEAPPSAECIAGRSSLPRSAPCASAWEEHANDFTAWARAPMHDSYWLYHRAQFLDLLPPPGELTLDIGCGEGRLARDLVALGHHVIALDGSPTMVENARSADPTMDVRLADAADLPLPDAVADLAVGFMSFQDIDDMPGAVVEAARVLRPGGRLCLAIVHPLNSAGQFTSREPNSPFVIGGSYLEPFGYLDEVERDGLSMSFASVHRPIQDYFAAHRRRRVARGAPPRAGHSGGRDREREPATLATGPAVPPRPRDQGVAAPPTKILNG